MFERLNSPAPTLDQRTDDESTASRHTLFISAIALVLLPASVLAQLSCDEPPAPFDNEDLLANWQRVWDLMDVCKSQEGVFFEIISGGVGRDGIPPIDKPRFDDLATADMWLQEASPVIALEVDGSARAYPLAILTRHEIANDTIGNTPVAVTFCPLCNSAIVFDRRVDGETLRFGVSGLLRNSDLIMWDDVTQTLWQQLTGEGIVGAHTGVLLDIVPSQLVGYGAFKAQYPQGEVLSTGGRAYGYNPYVNYDSSPRPFLFMGALDDRLLATERVLGATIKGEAVAYPFSALAAEGVINDRVSETDVVAIWQPGAFSALDAASIDRSRDVGMAALFERKVDDRTLTFEARGDDIVDVESGSKWNIFGTAIAGDLEGKQLRTVNAFPHFWFAWAAFYPDTTLYGYQPPSAEEIARYELDPVLGDPDAPVTLVEFGAYGCHACKHWHEEGIVEALLEEFEGRVNLSIAIFPSSSRPTARWRLKLRNARWIRATNHSGRCMTPFSCGRSRGARAQTSCCNWAPMSAWMATRSAAATKQARMWPPFAMITTAAPPWAFAARRLSL